MELRERKTLSQQDLDTAQAAERTTAAAVKQARANVETARLDLGYATVTAPIAGRAGRALVTEGALVGQGEATLLTTVEQIDPIYVNFSQSMQQVTELQRSCRRPRTWPVSGRRPGPGARSCRRTVRPARLPGHWISPIWRWIRTPERCLLRATLPNPEKALLPGMFVNLRLTAGAFGERLPAASGRPGAGCPGGLLSWWWMRTARCSSDGWRPTA